MSVYSKAVTNTLHPLTTASANGNDAVFTGEFTLFALNLKAVVELFYTVYVSVKIPLNLVLKLVIKIFKNNIIYICTKMSDRCVKKIKLILDTDFFEM